MKMREVISFGSLMGKTGVLATQELRAALAICSGMANKEIARELDCSPATVKKSIERIFFKFGVSNRAALVAEAFKLGVITFASNMAPDQEPQNHQPESSIPGVFVA
jgi:DNA-binding CsgD family transcriptional regulator